MFSRAKECLWSDSEPKQGLRALREPLEMMRRAWLARHVTRLRVYVTRLRVYVTAAASESFMSSIVLLAFLLFGWLIWRLARPPRIKPRSAAILVLGDIGRSPRIMYHAQSLAENNFETHLIGYGGTKPASMYCVRIHLFLGSRPIPLLEGHQRVHFHYLSEPPPFLKHMPFVLAAPIKVIHQIFGILVALLVRVSDAPEYI